MDEDTSADRPEQTGTGADGALSPPGTRAIPPSLLTEILSRLPTGVAVLRGTDFVHELTNPAYQEIFNIEDPNGSPVVDVFDDAELSSRLLERLRVVTSNAAVEMCRELVAPSKPVNSSGGSRVFDLVLLPLGGAASDETRVLLHATDVSEHAAARRAAEESRDLAERARNAESDFVATMSHELRTPINAVMAYIDLLEIGIGGPINERQRRYLERIKAGNLQLLALINEILDYAKLDSGRLEVETSPLRVQDVVDSAVMVMLAEAA
jgi:signal transduction histidine kinase